MATAHRDGKLVVIPHGAGLPENCVKCGRPVNGDLIFKEFSWPFPSFVHFLTLFFPIELLAAIPVHELVLSFVLCEEHRRYYRRLKWIAAGLLVGVLPAAIVIYDWNSDWAAVISLAMIAAGIVVASISRGPLRAVDIGAAGGRFKGASAAFLALLPPKGH